MMAEKGQAGQVLAWHLLLLLTTVGVVQGLMMALCSQHSGCFFEASL